MIQIVMIDDRQAMARAGANRTAFLAVSDLFRGSAFELLPLATPMHNKKRRLVANLGYQEIFEVLCKQSIEDVAVTPD